MTGSLRRPVVWAALISTVVLISLGVLAVLALAREPEPPNRAEPPRAEHIRTTPAAAPVDANGKQACDLAASTAAAALIDDPSTADGLLAAAMRAADQGVRFNGQMVYERAEIARQARGARDATSTALELEAAVIDLRTACSRAGF